MKILWLMGIGLFIIVFACERLTRPRLGSQAFELRELTTLVTETYLQLSGWERLAEATLRVYRNGQVLWDRSLQPGDTVLYDSTLSPARTYTYRAELWSGGQRLARSGPVTVTTMDTTSHNFEWEIIEFPSPFGSGALYDVAIINENDIWAVGEIYADSAQPWLPYNAVHWNGSKWELKRIQFSYFCNQPGTFPAPAKSVLAFGSNDIYIAAGSQLAHWNGEKQDDLQCIPVSVNKLWGTNNNNIFAVGAIGKIAHYDGVSWQRLESGVEVDFSSISGTADGRVVWVAGVRRPTEYGVVLQITPAREVEVLFSQERPLFGRRDDHIHSTAVWLSGAFGYGAYAGLDDTRLVRHRIGAYDRDYRILHSEPQGAIRAIKGNGPNDWFAVGTRDVVLHYNGISMKKYFHWPSRDIRYHSVDVKEDIVVACGIFFTNPNAALLLGKRKK